MVHEFGFVLAVKASVPADTLKTHFPAQMKVAPVSKIRDLVQLQLPGLALRAMPGAPPQIPWHAGYGVALGDRDHGQHLDRQQQQAGQHEGAQRRIRRQGAHARLDPCQSRRTPEPGAQAQAERPAPFFEQEQQGGGMHQGRKQPGSWSDACHARIIR